MPSLVNYSRPPSEADTPFSVAGMINRLHGQPDSYDKKSHYKFGRTLGAGTYGIVREAEVSGHKVAVKIILKKNVKGNESMVYDELKMLQSVSHPHIVRFHDWFESRVSAINRRRATLTGPGQILYRHAVGDRWRTVRQNL
jgi:serine/threonine protein kinase